MVRVYAILIPVAMVAVGVAGRRVLYAQDFIIGPLLFFFLDFSFLFLLEIKQTINYDEKKSINYSNHLFHVFLDHIEEVDLASGRVGRSR